MSETRKIGDGNNIASPNENINADKCKSGNNVDVDSENEISSSSEESNAEDDRQRELQSGYRIITEIVRQNK